MLNFEIRVEIQDFGAVQKRLLDWGGDKILSDNVSERRLVWD